MSGNAFHRTYTYAEARQILCDIAREIGFTPTHAEVPHSRAIVGALGCKNLTEAQELVGLVPNRAGPSVRNSLPEGWDGLPEPDPPAIYYGVDVAAERAASLARQAARRREMMERIGSWESKRTKRHFGAAGEDDFLPPPDLTRERRAG